MSLQLFERASERSDTERLVIVGPQRGVTPIRKAGDVPMTGWDRTWRGSGVVFAVLIIIAFVIYGSGPKLGASDAKLVSFYDGDRTRILIATVIFCFSFLNLLWFGAALASVLRDSGLGRLGLRGDRLQCSNGRRVVCAHGGACGARVLDRRLRPS